MDEKLTGKQWYDRFGEYFKANLAMFVDFADIDMIVYNNGKEAAVTAALEAAQRASDYKPTPPVYMGRDWASANDFWPTPAQRNTDGGFK